MFPGKSLDNSIPSTINVSIVGNSMEPTLHHGDEVSFEEFGTQNLRMGDIILCYHPFIKNKRIVKRVINIIKEQHIYIRGDNSNESSDSRSFGPINKNKIIAILKAKNVRKI